MHAANLDLRPLSRAIDRMSFEGSGIKGVLWDVMEGGRIRI